MNESDCLKKYQNLEDLIIYYKDEGSRFPEMMAIKQVLSFRDKNTQAYYLGINRTLDAILYKKKFDEERDIYKSFYEDVFFDRPQFPDKDLFFDNLKKSSEIYKRFIATRVYYDMFPKKEETLYDRISKIIPEDKRKDKFVLEIFLESEIEEIIRNETDEKKLKLFGTDNFLEYISMRERLDKLKTREFENEMNQLIPRANGQSDEDYRQDRLSILSGNYYGIKEKILAKKMIKYFPINELMINILKKNREKSIFEEDEDDE